MRKIALALIAFMTLLQIAAAVPVTNDTSFEIRAYRLDPDKYLKVEIVDAIPDSLRNVSSGSSIDISEYLERYIGRVETDNTGDTGDTGNAGDTGEIVDTPISMLSEHVVFAYRVAGNSSDTYRISMDFQPFYLNGQFSSDTDKCIAAAYEIGNESYTFSSTGGSSSSSGDKIVENAEQSKDSRIVLDSSSQTGSFVKQWTVENDSSEEWIVRGSVALDVDPVTFVDAEYGIYKSNVTVILEVVS